MSSESPPEVLVWRVPLGAPARVVEHALTLLDATERSRAAAFRGDHLRRRFVLRHAARRAILAVELATTPDAVRFGEGPAGKPHLRPAEGAGPAEGAPGRIEFNDTDSGDAALIAIARGRRVGVDLEQWQPLEPDLWETRRLFAPAERAALDALPEAARPESFFACWTRKEALLKALGTGLRVAPDVLAVPVGPLPPTGVRLDARPVESTRFTVRDLDVGPGFAAALALEGEGATVEWRVWDWTWMAGTAPSAPDRTGRGRGTSPTPGPASGTGV